MQVAHQGWQNLRAWAQKQAFFPIIKFAVDIKLTGGYPFF